LIRQVLSSMRKYATIYRMLILPSLIYLILNYFHPYLGLTITKNRLSMLCSKIALQNLIETGVIYL